MVRYGQGSGNGCQPQRTRQILPWQTLSSDCCSVQFKAVQLQCLLILMSIICFHFYSFFSNGKNRTICQWLQKSIRSEWLGNHNAQYLLAVADDGRLDKASHIFAILSDSCIQTQVVMVEQQMEVFGMQPQYKARRRYN